MNIGLFINPGTDKAEHLWNKHSRKRRTETVYLRPVLYLQCEEIIFESVIRTLIIRIWSARSM